MACRRNGAGDWREAWALDINASGGCGYSGCHRSLLRACRRGGRHTSKRHVTRLTGVCCRLHGVSWLNIGRFRLRVDGAPPASAVVSLSTPCSTACAPTAWPPILYSLDCHEVPKAPLGTALGLAHSLAVPPADTARSERHGRVAQDEQPWRVACVAAMHHTTRCGVGRAQSHGSHRTRPHLDHDERAQELQHAIARRSVRGRRGAAQHDQPCPVEYGEPRERAGERRRNRY